MSDKLTGLYFRARTRFHNDEGQGALEYIGILAVVVLLVAAIAAAVNGQLGTISSSIGEWVTDILDGTG